MQEDPNVCGRPGLRLILQLRNKPKITKRLGVSLQIGKRRCGILATCYEGGAGEVGEAGRRQMMMMMMMTVAFPFWSVKRDVS